MSRGYPIVGHGTSNHMVLVNVKDKGIDGARVEHFCSKVSISVNKNVIPGGLNAVVPGGLRLGSPAMTTRGCAKKDFEAIADFVDRAIHYSLDFKKDKANLASYKQAIDEAVKSDNKVKDFKAEVEAFAGQFAFFY